MPVCYGVFTLYPTVYKFFFDMPDDGKLAAESDSGEFWVLFGGFAPLGKKAISEDDIIPEATPAQLYKYATFILYCVIRQSLGHDS